MIDPKPLAAFLEYSVRPILQDSVELLERMEKHGIKARDAMSYFAKLYITNLIFNFASILLVTGSICYILLNFLRMNQ